MKKYRVALHPDAETDISSSYQWGCRVWGQKQANARGPAVTSYAIEVAVELEWFDCYYIYSIYQAVFWVDHIV